MRCVCSATSRVGSMTSTCGAPDALCRTPSAMMAPKVTVLPVPDFAYSGASQREGGWRAPTAGARLHNEVGSEAAEGDGSLLYGRGPREAGLVEGAHERVLELTLRQGAPETLRPAHWEEQVGERRRSGLHVVRLSLTQLRHSPPAHIQDETVAAKFLEK